MIYTKWVSCSIVHLQMRLIIIIIIIILTSCGLLSLFVVFFFLHFLMDFLDVGGLKISQEKNTVSQVQYEKKKNVFFLISEHVNLLL